ncbi:MAG: hypothetical protein ACC707_17685 [Thiohalomonadales bacterium]
MTLHPRIYLFRVLIIAATVSVVWHLLLIFYMPPFEDMEIFSLQSQSGLPENNLRIKLAGKKQSGTTDEQGEPGQAGSISDEFSIDNEKWAELLSKLEDNTGLTNAYKANNDDIDSKTKVKKSYIYRERKHEDIVIKDVFPTIHNINKPFAEILAAAPKDLQEHNERNQIIKSYRDWTLGKNNATTLFVNIENNVNKRLLTPLIFPKNKRTQYFDDNLTLPKGLQLSNFIRRYFHYDPDKGDLPIATRELYYQNLQRLAYSFSSDPSFLFLDYFLENLNKEDFLKNSLFQASKLDGTKTQTELLFALEDIYHIQQRAWRYYFQYEKIYPSFPEKNKLYLRNETLKRVIEGYKDTLKSKDIDSYEKIEYLYRIKREEILDYLIAHTPEAYRLSDALFEKAALYWQAGYRKKDSELMAKAVELWASIPLEEPQQATSTSNLSQTTLKQLSPSLVKFLRSNGLSNQAATHDIQRIISSRHSVRILKKRQREEQLLWTGD